MNEVWRRIRQWLHQHAPEIDQSLLPGASRDELDAAEKLVGAPFPEDVRGSYAVCNGSRGGAAPLVGEWELLSLPDVTARWKKMRDLLESGTFGDNEARAKGRVLDKWWAETWVPVAHDMAGNFICVDLAPPAGGRRGQLIFFRHADPLRTVVADSLADWLGAFATDLEQGKYHVDKDGWLVRSE